jgi:hypothetical protein
MVTPDINGKKCNSCWAFLPIEAFGSFKYHSDGYNKHCKECRAQYLRIARKRKYNARGRVDKDDSKVRSVRIQNLDIIGLGMATNELKCVGFNVDTKQDCRVVFGKSQISGLNEMVFYTLDGSLYRSFQYSGQTKDVSESLYQVLKTLRIRLELTEADAITSKSTIYYL